MHLVFLLLPASDLRPRGPEARGGRVARAVEWAGGDNQWEEGDSKSWGRSAVGIGASDNGSNGRRTAPRYWGGLTEQRSSHRSKAEGKQAWTMPKNGTACAKRLKLSGAGWPDGRYCLCERGRASSAGGISKLAPAREISCSASVLHTHRWLTVGPYQKLWDRMLSTRGERGVRRNPLCETRTLRLDLVLVRKPFVSLAEGEAPGRSRDGPGGGGNKVRSVVCGTAVRAVRTGGTAVRRYEGRSSSVQMARAGRTARRKATPPSPLRR